MTKARELAELGTTLSVDGSGNADLAGILTTDGLTVDTSGDIRLKFSYSRVADADSGGGWAGGYNAYVDGGTVKHDSTGTLSAIHYNSSGINLLTDESAVAGTVAKKRALIAPNGDISFYEDTGTTAKFFWDASAEALGIGTSSPWANLSLPFGAGLSFGSSTYPLTISRSASGQLITTIADGYDSSSARIDFVMRNGHPAQNTALSIAGSGNVGIGTSSPAEGIHLARSNATALIESTDGTQATLDLKNTEGHFIIGNDGGSLFVFDQTDTAERFRIDTSGNVGIGQSSTDSKLTLRDDSDTTGPIITIKNQYRSGTTTADYIGGIAFSAWRDVSPSASYVAGIYGRNYGYPGNNGYLTFHTGNNGGTDPYNAGSVRMTIDPSGNVLVGKTSTSGAVVGLSLEPVGIIKATRSSNISGYFNREDSDGSIVSFAKDDTTVGSIKADNSQLVVTASSSNLVFENPTRTMSFSSGALAGAGASNDAVIDLGISNRRFKNLYLSGGVYLGGTGAANLLDDYEEGTWTPYLNGYSGTTYSSQLGWYEKIGRFVRASFRLDIASKGTYVGNTRISGLPFSSGTTDTPSQGCQPTLITALNATRSDQYLAIYNSGADMFAYSSGGGVYNGNHWQAGLVTGVITYWTNA